MENVNEPVADWLPIVLLFETILPSLNSMAEKGLLVLVPLEVTPVKLTLAIVLLLIFEVVPPLMPLKRIPRNEPDEPVKA